MERNKVETRQQYINVKDFGAVGDGVADDTAPIQQALNYENATVIIPEGNYRITKTLVVSSHSIVQASEKARLFLCHSAEKKRGVFLLSNRHTETGDVDITIQGGIWDGNYDGKNTTKPNDIFDSGAWSGTVLNFKSVKQLQLINLTVINSTVFHIRLCRIDGFQIENIRFSSEQLAFNQDGLHFGGECRNGVVRNIIATDGQTNDDLIALNADDCTDRAENFDLICGAIENIVFENIKAENCFTAIRFLSVRHPIRNIVVRNITCGCRVYAINMDGARYCKTPLFREEEYPDGCGQIENISIENMEVYGCDNRDNPLILAETRCKNFVITGFKHNRNKEASWRHTLQVGNLPHSVIVAQNTSVTAEYRTNDKGKMTIDIPFDTLTINCLKG